MTASEEYRLIKRMKNLETVLAWIKEKLPSEYFTNDQIIYEIDMALRMEKSE